MTPERDDYPYPPSDMIRLQDHVDAMFREKEKALDAVAKERDRAAEVLRETTETAAAAVRGAAERQAKDSYDRLDEKIAALRRENTIEFAARDTALLELKGTTKERDMKNNEFRAQLAAQALAFLPRKEFDALHTETVRQLSAQRDDLAVVRQAVAVGPPEVPIFEKHIASTVGQMAGRDLLYARGLTFVGVIASLGGVIAYIVTH